MSKDLVSSVLKALTETGVQDVALCPGSRNACFVQHLSAKTLFNVVTWYEERSAAFHTLGTIKRTHRPAAIITTSGTAVAELLPAAMEAHYLGLPLILITADRPRRFRRSGSPQCAEQMGLFTQYSTYEEDLASGEEPTFHKHWGRKGVVHLNICLEDPKGMSDFSAVNKPKWKIYNDQTGQEQFHAFLNKAKHPLVIVSSLTELERDPVKRFLLKLKAPVYLEAHSGLREDEALKPLAIRIIDGLWQRSAEHHYPIDSVLRIGGIPTLRPWRDLDDKEGHISVFSISSIHFPGLYWSKCMVAALSQLDKMALPACNFEDVSRWINSEKNFLEKKLKLYHSLPHAEPSLMHHLSKMIPQNAFVYLGNSLPIREWDLAASYDHPHSFISGNRGVNGIDGQVSTFLGMCVKDKPCWGIFGDLTMLYDMAAPWILAHHSFLKPIFVVINNGGGMIFSQMYPEHEFQNRHVLSFRPFSEMWGMDYFQWHTIPEKLPANCGQKPTLIEINPDNKQTDEFWKRIRT